MAKPPLLHQKKRQKIEDPVLAPNAESAKKIPDKIKTHYRIPLFSNAINILMNYLETNKLKLSPRKSKTTPSNKKPQ